MRRTLALLAFAASAFASAQFPGAVPPPANLKKGFDAIKEADARSILAYLAGPECMGRGTGQPGFQKAAEYMAGMFQQAGLKPGGENGTYFQFGTFYKPALTGASFVTPDGEALADRMFTISPTGKDVDLTAGVVLVRGGAQDRLSDEQLKAINGKIVIAILPTGRSSMRTQLNQSEASAILTLADRVSPATPRISMRNTPSTIASRPTGQITREGVSKLGSTAGAFLAQAQGGANVMVIPREVKLSGKGAMEEVKVPNVVAILEGSDPVLKNEYIGIGAHLDHLGEQNGTVYWGADDDGSGSTAIQLVAKGLAANPVKPKRSVVFMAFFGEEMGLLGSKYYVDHPTVPLDKMVAEFQMDMVGRDSDGVQNGDQSRVDKADENRDTIRLVGSKRISTELDATIQDVNRHVGFKFKYDAEDVYTRSDHYNFAAKGIPIAFLFDGFHPDYHQPTDTIEKINYLKLTNSAKLYYLSVLAVANKATPPKKDVPPGQ